MKYILITGGAGFIGSHLCKYLLKEDQNNVILCVDNLISGFKNNLKEILDHPNFHFWELDITESLEEPLKKYKLDEIYHLACIASPPKYKKYSLETLKTCFQGTLNMLELARKHHAKLLFTSTSEIYGDPLVHPQPEEYFGNVNTVGERSCYDEGKRIGETLIYEYNRLYSLEAKIVRIFNTYGPFMDKNDGRVITNFIKQIISGQPLVIYGDGNQTRSFCYIEDMVNGLVKMMNSKEKGPINLGNPYCELTLNELVKVFEKVSGEDLKVQYIEFTENDPKKRKPVITKAKKLLDWECHTEIVRGLEKTLEYFLSLE